MGKSRGIRYTGWTVNSAAHVPTRLSGKVSRNLLRFGIIGAGLFIPDIGNYGSLSSQIRNRQAS